MIQMSVVSKNILPVKILNTSSVMPMKSRNKNEYVFLHWTREKENHIKSPLLILLYNFYQ